MNKFIAELRWRGMLQDTTPETENYLNNNRAVGYIGFDPTADSLHIGSLVQLFILRHFQNCGHRPVVLLGGATGRIGDPSGKSDERNLLSIEEIDHNIQKIKLQFKKFLNFDKSNPTAALLVNNYDWTKDISLLDFSRDIGKHLTVNYMIAKDSVKKRLEKESTYGMSFTEFTYQLLQGFDFLYLFKNYNCQLQMGGSDQWGNITTGIELIRRKSGKKAYGLTCPLIVKTDGTKFGKTESGNVWLDKSRTSVYKFYQYWINISDKDAENYIKIFTFLDKKKINMLIKEHYDAPHLRILQKQIAEKLTLLVHSKEDLENVKRASQILFGASTTVDLKKLDESTFLDVFEGVLQAKIQRKKLEKKIEMVSALSILTNFLSSNSEARRSLRENAIMVNKARVNENYFLTKKDLINDKYIVLQRGKKNYFLIEII